MPVAADPVLRDQAKALYLQGLTPVSIAQQLKLSSPKVVYNWIARANWRPVKEAVEQRVEQSVSKVVANGLMKQGVRLRTALATELDQQAECLAREPVAAYSELANSKDGQGRAAVVKTIVEAATKVYGWDDPAASGLLGAGLRDLDSIDIEEVSNPPQLTDSQTDKPV